MNQPEKKVEKVGLLGGFLWSSIDRYGGLLIKFFIQISLARLLLPEEFGLVAMIAVFITVGIGVMDSGFTQVIIQRPSLSERELTTIFYANLVIGSSLTLFAFFIAPFIAQFFSEPKLTLLLRFLILTLLFTALGRVQSSQMIRMMMFKRLAMVTLPVTLLGGLVALVLAFLGFGVWALIWNSLVVAAFSSLGYWLALRWKPQGAPSWALFRDMLPFGAQMTTVRVLNLIAENGMFVLVGRLFPVAQVGHLQCANSLRMVSGNTLCILTERVMFPYFSRSSGNADVIQNLYIRYLLYGGAVLAILLSYLGANAADLIVLIFGKVWFPAAAYFEVLCVFGFLYVFHRVVLVYVKAQGYGSLLVGLTLIEKSIIIAVLVFSIKWGILVMLWSMVVSSALSLLIKFALLKYYLGCSLGRQVSNVIIPTCIGFCLWCVAQYDFHYSEVLIFRLLVSAFIVGSLVFVSGWIYIKINHPNLLDFHSFLKFREALKNSI